MKTRALALIALAVALGGCRENLTSVAANGFCWPPEDAATCGAPSCDTLVGGAFTMASAAGSLQSWIEWQNHMENNAIEGERTNTNDFLLEGYEWEIVSPLATRTIRDRFTNSSLVRAGGTAVIGLDVIPPTATGALEGDYALWAGTGTMPVRVRLKAFGRLGDDTYYETGTTVAAVNFFIGTLTPACPESTQTLRGTCPPNGNQAPVSLVCEEADSGTTTTP